VLESMKTSNVRSRETQTCEDLSHEGSERLFVLTSFLRSPEVQLKVASVTDRPGRVGGSTRWKRTNEAHLSEAQTLVFSFSQLRTSNHPSSVRAWATCPPPDLLLHHPQKGRRPMAKAKAKNGVHAGAILLVAVYFFSFFFFFFSDFLCSFSGEGEGKEGEGRVEARSTGIKKVWKVVVWSGDERREG